MSGFRLHLLRHGAPVIPGLMLGRTDMASTPEGIALCVRRAREAAFETVLASDLIRASAAAEAIAAPRGLVPTISPRWRELDFGLWDGVAPAEIDADALQRFRDDPDRAPPPNGECWSDLVARVSAGITALAPRDTLIVTHGGTIRAALATLCGFDMHQVWAFDLPYAALVSLRVWPGSAPFAQITGIET
ncbi:phosphoglycerate/bisphosphoglycerate mutase [Novosphingobium nitrogenifigens DSM 19370]|uniref:Phosphoglycerate/bisphosphoglycerate mutase n=1 Tax=Novosphingobium nitrogenifigens DSM 19370 TaxID=983920 RepID=F1Z393_9SPHN|nr:histidine phosphatase family protein [Novosphingobium nitrogenifigens]EGD60920.1 phosphoglycerate/bisphosphoglycerate mutase [Novosphingobium nitrogenifigens DSM 19370]